jgi:serine/threonine protein kinase
MDASQNRNISGFKPIESFAKTVKEGVDKFSNFLGRTFYQLKLNTYGTYESVKEGDKLGKGSFGGVVKAFKVNHEALHSFDATKQVEFMKERYLSPDRVSSGGVERRSDMDISNIVVPHFGFDEKLVESIRSDFTSARNFILNGELSTEIRNAAPEFCLELDQMTDQEIDSVLNNPDKFAQMFNREGVNSGEITLISKAIYIQNVAIEQYAAKMPKMGESSTKSTLNGVDTKNLKEHFAEIDLMKKMSPHKNVLGLKGVAPSGAAIVPLCNGGDLLDYVKRKELSLDQKIVVMQQISEGLKSIHDDGIVHRDIAARNILLNFDGKGGVEAKVADFGLAKEMSGGVFKAKAGAQFPVRWSPPEVARESTFSVASDVYSLGVLFNEIMQNGEKPFTDNVVNKQVMTMLQNSYKGSILNISSTENASDEEVAIINLMKRMTDADPIKRPSIGEVLETLKEHANPSVQFDNRRERAQTVEYIISVAAGEVAYES